MSTVTLDFDECKMNTGMAVLLDFGDDDTEWIPVSCIKGEVPDIGELGGKVEVKRWFAVKKGLV